MKVRTTDSAASNLEDDIARLNQFGLGALDDLDCVLALPGQSLHGLIRVTVLFSVVSRVGDVLGSDSVVAVTNSPLGQCCCLCYCGHFVGILCVVVNETRKQSEMDPDFNYGSHAYLSSSLLPTSGRLHRLDVTIL